MERKDLGYLLPKMIRDALLTSDNYGALYYVMRYPKLFERKIKVDSIPLKIGKWHIGPLWAYKPLTSCPISR